jgi:hypothetical protein
LHFEPHNVVLELVFFDREIMCFSQKLDSKITLVIFEINLTQVKIKLVRLFKAFEFLKELLGLLNSDRIRTTNAGQAVDNDILNLVRVELAKHSKIELICFFVLRQLIVDLGQKLLVAQRVLLFCRECLHQLESLGVVSASVQDISVFEWELVNL